MKKYLVIGNPIDHSFSPKLHNFWIKNNNINAIYEKKKLDNNESFKEVFNVVSKGELSFFDNAKIIHKYLIKINKKKYFNKKIQAVNSSFYKSIALRPKKTSLNTKKIEKFLKIKLPNYKSEIKNYFYGI